MAEEEAVSRAQASEIWQLQQQKAALSHDTLKSRNSNRPGDGAGVGGRNGFGTSGSGGEGGSTSGRAASPLPCLPEEPFTPLSFARPLSSVVAPPVPYVFPYVEAAGTPASWAGTDDSLGIGASSSSGGLPGTTALQYSYAGGPPLATRDSLARLYKDPLVDESLVGSSLGMGLGSLSSGPSDNVKDPLVGSDSRMLQDEARAARVRDAASPSPAPQSAAAHVSGNIGAGAVRSESVPATRDRPWKPNPRSELGQGEVCGFGSPVALTQSLHLRSCIMADRHCVSV